MSPYDQIKENDTMGPLALIRTA